MSVQGLSGKYERDSKKDNDVMKKSKLAEVMDKWKGHASVPMDELQTALASEQSETPKTDGWNVEFKKGQSTITLLLGVEHEGKKGQLVFREGKV